MSNLDIPNAQNYFKVPPNDYRLEYHSPTKATIDNRDNYAKNPVSSEAKQLNNYYELKNSLEQRYQSDLDRWKVRAEESETRRQALEQENLRLIEELNFWKTKNFSAEREKDYEVELQEQLARSQVEIAQRSVGTHQDLLHVEIESLRNQLHQKMRELDEWNTLYFNQELKTNNLRQTSEDQLRAYEGQLNSILRDIQAKIDESDELHRQNTSLSSVPSKLASVKKEVKDIKSQLDYKFEESEKLNQDLAKSQVENYSMKKNEMKLREQEHNLLAQIEGIQNKIERTNKLKDEEEQQADKEHHDLLEKIKQDHMRVKEALDAKKLTYSQFIVEKEKNLDELRHNLENVQKKIGNTRSRETSSKKEAQDWKLRNKSIEQQREQEVKRIDEEREQEHENLRKSHYNERDNIEKNINSLRSELNKKENQIRETSNNLTRSRLAKENLSTEKRILEAEIQRKLLLSQEAERQRQIDLEVRDRLHQQEMETLRNSHLSDKQRLEEQDKTLNYVLDAKQKEAQEEKERASKYLISAEEAERKVREKSVEADVFRQQYVKTDREKSIEVEVARELRRSQIQSLQKSHDQELMSQVSQNSALRNVLDSKQSEVRRLRDENGNLIHDLINTSQEAKRAEIQAQIWRGHAEFEERDRHHALVSRDIAQSHELDAIRRAQLAQTHHLRSEISALSGVVDHKAREAADWRDNYNRLYSSSYRKY